MKAVELFLKYLKNEAVEGSVGVPGEEGAVQKPTPLRCERQPTAMKQHVAG